MLRTALAVGSVNAFQIVPGQEIAFSDTSGQVKSTVQLDSSIGKGAYFH